MTGCYLYQSPSTHQCGGYLLSDQILKSNAFRVVILELSVGGEFGGKDLQVVDVADIPARVNVNPDGNLVSLQRGDPFVKR